LGCFLFAKINQLLAPIVNISMENTNQSGQITISDLDAIKNIIDLATSRGAFRGSELSSVGTVYDKLTAFLQAVIEQAKAQEAANADISEPQGE
jgi:hypothetical protein